MFEGSSDTVCYLDIIWSYLYVICLCKINHIYCLHYDEITTLCSWDKMQRHLWQNFSSPFRRHLEGELRLVALLRLLNHARTFYSLSFYSVAYFIPCKVNIELSVCLFSLFIIGSSNQNGYSEGSESKNQKQFLSSNPKPQGESIQSHF